jgi:hypothetical protein
VPYEGVWSQVEKLAHKSHAKVTEPKIELKVEKARATIKEFKRTPLPDVECFARTIERLESDIDLLRDRANAWAVGDVDRFRRLAPVERASACIGLLLESSMARERGYSDLLMARPLRRDSAITRSVIMLVAAATLTNVMMLAGTWAGLTLFARNKPQWPAPAMFLSLAAGLWALMFCWGGVGLAFGASARRRGAAGAGAGLVTVAFYLLDLVARVWEPARRVGLGRLSPFHYFNPVEIISGRTFPLAHAAVLLGVGGAAIALGYVIYTRRDL